ncbi:hypothetical protein K501DRAFT_297834 [Backusella circina FSU 941]|nr:hypothetical protein K501DRAFT_297834 [Backusella circina FSU 941]
MRISVSLLVNYQTVKNVINARSSSDKDGVKKWADELENENNYRVIFKNHESVVRGPITNRCVPVCQFITDYEMIPTLYACLNCPTEIVPNREVFGDTVNILLYHWHIKRAWDTHLKKLVKVAVMQKAVRTSLNSMIYSNSPESFDLAFACFEEQFKEYKSFTDYFKSTCYRKKTLFIKAWRSSATFHTNNFIESYHNIFKTVYLGRSRGLRVDHFVYVLVKLVSVDYYQDTVLCLRGLRQPNLCPREEERRQKGNEISYEEGVSMIEKTSSYLFCCSCPAVRFCKHIFLIHRINGLPFTLCAILTSTINTNQLLSESPLKYSRMLNDLTKKRQSILKTINRSLMSC